MLEVMKTTLNIYQNYGGDSMMTLLVMAAILYLWVSEERREVKILFVYLVTGIIALFFFPVFSYIAIHFFWIPRFTIVCSGSSLWECLWPMERQER